MDMNPDWLFYFAGATTISAVVFVCVGVIWLRRLRETVAAALREAAGHQIRIATTMSEALACVQKQQNGCTQQIQTLAEAGLRLQQEIASVSNRLESTQGEPRNHTIH